MVFLRRYSYGGQDGAATIISSLRDKSRTSGSSSLPFCVNPRPFHPGAFRGCGCSVFCSVFVRGPFFAFLCGYFVLGFTFASWRLCVRFFLLSRRLPGWGYVIDYHRDLPISALADVNG